MPGRHATGEIVTDRDCEVVVVGGGLAGLTAARRLVRRNADVRVLEARDRVGGRTLSRDLAGETVDLGAQWIGPGQHHVRALVEDLDVETFEQYTTGESAFHADGTVGRHEDAIRALGLPTQLNLLYAIRKLNRMSREVPLAEPHEAPAAAAWDAETVATWRDSVLKTGAGRDAFDAVFRAVFGSEPKELSLLYFLFYVASAGGFGRLTSVEGGAQQTRLVGGTQQLSERMAADLGDRVHLDSPVRAIEQDDDGVTVHAEGRSVGGAYAIVAVPPTLAGRIDYDPSLPARRDGLTQRTPMGAVIKCVAAYEEPFWRAEGRSGEVIDAGGPVGLVYDDSPSDGSTGALVGFLLGDDARAWADAGVAERRVDEWSESTDGASGDGGAASRVCEQSERGAQRPASRVRDQSERGAERPASRVRDQSERGAERPASRVCDRKEAVLDQFAAYFGSAAADPEAYVDQVWANDRYSRGCYAGNMPPGALTSYGEALREPCGRIHWAGTETAKQWYGYMDGAVSSGKRVAAEVLDRLD